MACIFSERNLFSLIGLDTFINIRTIERINESWYFQSFENESKSKIKKVSVDLQNIDRKENYVLYYNSEGFLEKEDRDVLEKYTDNYSYDENDRLLSYKDFSYVYIDDFQRECYLKGVLHERECLDWKEDKLIVTVIYYSKRYSDGVVIETGKSIYEYNLKDGYVFDVYCTHYNREGIEIRKKKYLRFSYQNNLLKSIIEYYGEEIRYEKTFEYQDEKLVKQNVKFRNKVGKSYVAYFLDYDDFGNYTRYMRNYDDGSQVSFIRKIEYIGFE